MYTIIPENETEKLIMSDPEWLEGAAWGMPREGHPEGAVYLHIQEVLANIDKYAPDPDDRRRLRLVGLIHDTFKNKVDITKPRVGENNHAVIASQFANKYLSDTALLDIIELHDEAFNAWKKGNDTGKWPAAEDRLNRLFERLNDNIRLFSIFYRCDNETGSKDQACVRWFEEQLARRKL